MRKRINFQLLKSNQLRAQKSPNPLQQSLYQASSQLINDLLTDIKRPFKNICIHGFYQQMMIDHIVKHRNGLMTGENDKGTQKQGEISQIDKSHEKLVQFKEKPKLTIVDYLDVLEQRNYQNQIFQTKIIKLQNTDAFLNEQEQFDLVISNLQLNHTNNEQKLLQKYLHALKPDGALIGCAMVEGTLSELQWSYLMAENQRYGGLSPKVMNFPSIGQLGNLLTQTHYHLATILNRDYHLQLDSPLDVIKLLQHVGESGHLRGRRKAVYKELLVSMYALYQSEFVLQNEEEKREKVLATVVLSPFVGWKYSPDQPKPLRRGQHGDSIDFVDELRKFDPELQHFRITEDNEPQEIRKDSKGKEEEEKEGGEKK